MTSTLDELNSIRALVDSSGSGRPLSSILVDMLREASKRKDTTQSAIVISTTLRELVSSGFPCNELKSISRDWDTLVTTTISNSTKEAI